MDAIAGDQLRLSPRRRCWRPTSSLLIALALLLLATQSLGAAHRASHRPLDPPFCQTCAVSGSPLAVAPAPLPQPVALQLDGELPLLQHTAHEALRTATSPRGPPSTRSPLPA